MGRGAQHRAVLHLDELGHLFIVLCGLLVLEHLDEVTERRQRQYRLSPHGLTHEALALAQEVVLGAPLGAAVGHLLMDWGKADDRRKGPRGGGGLSLRPLRRRALGGIPVKERVRAA